MEATLEWLQDKIDETNSEYLASASAANEPTDVRFYGFGYLVYGSRCTVDFGYRWSWHSKARDGGPEGVSLFKVPLGDSRITIQPEVQSTHFPDGNEPAFALLITASSKIIARDSSTAPGDRKITYVDTAFIRFNDESIAQRAITAFQHAADLCLLGPE